MAPAGLAASKVGGKCTLMDMIADGIMYTACVSYTWKAFQPGLVYCLRIRGLETDIELSRA